MRQIKWKLGIGVVFSYIDDKCVVTKCPISNTVKAGSIACAKCKFNESSNGPFKPLPNPFVCSAPPLASELHKGVY